MILISLIINGLKSPHQSNSCLIISNNHALLAYDLKLRFNINVVLPFADKTQKSMYTNTNY